MFFDTVNKAKTLIETLPERRLAFFLFLTALVLRGLYALLFFFTQPIPETNAYYEIAEIILEQKRIFYFTGELYYESASPVIPWLNALTMLVFGENYLGLYLVTALGSALITFYTYKTARLYLDKSISFFAGLWSTFYLFYFYYTPSPGKDIWMAFFMIFLIYYLLLLFEKKQFSYPKYILFIVMFATSFHLDERFFIFAPFIGLYILFCETSGFKKFTVFKTVTYGFLLILLMVPWTIRNYENHGKIVILSTRTEAFTDPIFGYEPRGHMMDKFNNIYGVYYIHNYQIDSVIAGTKKVTDGGRTISKAQVEAMRRGEIPEPLTGFRAFWSRTVSFLEPIQLHGRYERSGYFYYKKSLPHNIATLLFYGILFISSFPGFYFLFKINKSAFYIFISTIIIYTLIHALTIPYTNWRYRLPLDSIFIIVGWLGIISIYRNTLKNMKYQ